MSFDRTPEPTAPRPAAPCCYERRHPEESTLYQVISRGLPAFLEHRAEREVPVPAFVVRALRGYLTCGVLEHGFCRLKCAQCGEEMVVARPSGSMPSAPTGASPSCKDRGFCPSCLCRRMCDTAAHLVDCVLPDVPVRQWVLSLPPRLRMLCAITAQGPQARNQPPRPRSLSNH
ncbi:hypothetical protein L6V77_05980 [Myxococcota bacterium]|nr:hypothetical protein [Myxococcota bacterium]